MRNAAVEMRFELAAVYRDQLRAIEKVREEQRVVTIDDIDRDVLGFYRQGDLVEIALLHVRAGKLAEVATYSIFLAFGAAALSGLFFGTYPAARAASLRPIEALRFE